VEAFLRASSARYVSEMKRWTGWIVVGVLALTLGAVLFTHPWSEPEIPAASEYSSPWNLAHDLNDHGLGCSNPTLRPSARNIVLPEPVVCSVDGEPVVLDVIPPRLLKGLINAIKPKSRYTNLQDLVDDVIAKAGTSRLRELLDVGVDAILVGPNWTVSARENGDSIAALSAIRDEIGGTLVVAPSPATPASPSSPTPHASSA
jgi:hypothetical protein